MFTMSNRNTTLILLRLFVFGFALQHPAGNAGLPGPPTADLSLDAAERAQVEALTNYALGAYAEFEDHYDWEPISERYLAALRHDPHSEYLLDEVLRVWETTRYELAPELVIEHIASLAAANPNAIRLQLVVADAYLRRDRHNDAERVLTAIDKRTRWSNPAIIRDLARALLGRGKIHKAHRLFQKALAPSRLGGVFSAEYAAALFYHTVTTSGEYSLPARDQARYEAQGRHHAMNAVAAISATSPEIHYDEIMGLAGLLLTSNDVARAIDVLEQVRTVGSENTEIDKVLAECYEAAERFEPALEIWNELSRRNPYDPLYHVRIGGSYRQLERWDDALLAYHTAYQINGNPNLAFEIASLYLRLDQPEKALTFAGNAPAHLIHTYMLLSYIYREMGQLATARNVLLKAGDIAAGSQDPDIRIDYYLSLATVYHLEENREQTVVVLEKALALDPMHSEANNFLGYYLADENISLERAESLIRIAVAGSPDNPAYLDSLAWVLYRRGRYSQAAAQILTAIDLIGNAPDSVILDHAGDIFNALGDTAKARHYWQRAVELGPDDIGEIHKKIRKLDTSDTLPAGRWE